MANSTQARTAPAPPSGAAARPREYSLGFLLADVLRLSREEFRRNAKGLNLTPELSRLLFYVDQQPGCSQAELATFLDVTSVTVGRMIDRLESCGFVRRLEDASDRRAFRIHLDRAAAPLLKRMNGILAQTTARATHGFSAAEHAALVAALERMRTNLAPERN
jgi:MarR family transcriptional regulator for hemolysin